jgi:metal-responsive CopG/Arc/MetJ family transcriptional regulator
MSAERITISIDQDLLEQVDNLVKTRVFDSRSEAVQTAIREKIKRMDKARLAKECAKLDKAAEQALADEGLAAEVDEWPEF